MKSLKILYLLTIIIVVSCGDKDSENQILETTDYQCRDVEVINKASYSDMTEIEKLEYKCDSLITEAYNLIVCEECETTNWNSIYYRKDFCADEGYFPYSVKTDTIILFEIINKYNELKESYYNIQKDSKGDSILVPACTEGLRIPFSHVECQNGKPIVINSIKLLLKEFYLKIGRSYS